VLVLQGTTMSPLTSKRKVTTAATSLPGAGFMRTIAKLFGNSPFVPLQAHMEKVAACVAKVPELFAAMKAGDHASVERLAAEASNLEHEADQVKHDIRNNLPKSLFLAVDRGRLLDILKVQDQLADKAENIGVLLTLKQMTLQPWMAADFEAFLAKNLDAFASVRDIINELDELLETGFGGEEAERVMRMIDAVAFKEHEADVLQRVLLKSLYANDADMTVGEFSLWSNLFKQVSDLSNLSERLANRVRRTLELKS